MQHLKTLFVILFLIIISCKNAFAQQRVNVPNIDILTITDDMYLILFEKIGQDAYKYKELFIEEDVDSFLEISFDEEDNYVYTLAEIQEEYEQLMYVNDLAPISDTFWYDSDWQLQSDDNSLKENYILKFPSKHLAAYLDLEIFDENPSKWNIVDEYWFQNIIIDFGNGKELLLLAEDEEIIFTCIPLQNTVKVFADEEELTQMIPVTKDKYFVNFHDALKDFDTDYMYAIEKDEKTNKYQLLDYFKNDLLQTSYDTIIYNEYFIIGKNEKDYTFYNSYLEKIEIPTVEKVYPQNDELEVLTRYGAEYYNHLGEIASIGATKSMVLGNPKYQYKLLYNHDRKYRHSLKIFKRNRAHTREETREFIFTNIKNKNSISFLDNTNSKDWDENTGRQTKYPQYLKVQSGKKFGLFSYDYIMSTNDSDREIVMNGTQRKIIHRNPARIKVKEELPIQYDDIKIYNSLIVFYKNDKLGIFQKQQNPQYESIQAVTASFYRIIKDGKVGWLDIKTMEEHF
jgi:hypothetical protein